MEQKTAAVERTGDSIGPGDQIPPGGMTGPEPLKEQAGKTSTATIPREHAPPLTAQADAGATTAAGESWDPAQSDGVRLAGTQSQR